MQEVFRAIGRLPPNITVLINGESGTGKELVAHAPAPPLARARRAVHRTEHGGDPQRT